MVSQLKFLVYLFVVISKEKEDKIKNQMSLIYTLVHHVSSKTTERIITSQIGA